MSCRGRGILEGLVGHDVTPVARRIADRQQDGLVLAPRARQRFFAPRIPVHGVVRMLLKIRTRLRGESIPLHRRYPRRLECAPS